MFLCPKCLCNTVKIHCAATHWDHIILSPEGTVDEEGGNTDWPDDAQAECTACDFKGTIDQFLSRDEFNGSLCESACEECGAPIPLPVDPDDCAYDAHAEPEHLHRMRVGGYLCICRDCFETPADPIPNPKYGCPHCQSVDLEAAFQTYVWYKGGFKEGDDGEPEWDVESDWYNEHDTGACDAKHLMTFHCNGCGDNFEKPVRIDPQAPVLEPGDEINGKVVPDATQR